MPKYLSTLHQVTTVSASVKFLQERQRTAVHVIISPRGGVQEKILKKFHSTENESFSPLPIFIHGTEICSISFH